MSRHTLELTDHDCSAGHLLEGTSKSALHMHVCMCVHARSHHSNGCGESMWKLQIGELGRGVTGAGSFSEG